MLNPTYLQLSRHGVFYFRWPIPKRLHPSSLSSTMKVSLRTRSPKTALRLSRSIGQMADRATSAALVDGMRYDEVRKLLKQHFDKLLTTHVEAINETGRLSAFDRNVLESSLQLGKAAVAAGTTLLNLGDETVNEVDRFVSAYKLDIDPNSPTYRTLKNEIPNSYRDYVQAVLAYDSSLDSYDIQAIRTDAPVTAPPPPPVGMTIERLATSYETEKKLGKAWVAKTEQEKGGHINLLK